MIPKLHLASLDVGDCQELNVLFLLSSTSKKLLDSLELVTGDSKDGVIGAKRVTIEEDKYKVILHHEQTKRKLSQEMIIGNMDLVVMVFSDMQELTQILSNEIGLLNYIKQYWRGFFRLLLIQIGNGMFGNLNPKLLDQVSHKNVRF